MIDIVREIDAVHRELGSRHLRGTEARSLLLRRTYDAPIDDVWDAITSPERITRWLMPITGDFRLGGRYQLEGNAGGEIVRCQAQDRLTVTWVYGEPSSEDAVSEVDVRLASVDGGSTLLELRHTAVVPAEMWNVYGPGAVGVGWDQMLLGLGLHLRGESVGDPTAWQLSEDGRGFSSRSSEAWGAATRAAGAGTPDEVAVMIANTTAFYTADPSAPS